MFKDKTLNTLATHDEEERCSSISTKIWTGNLTQPGGQTFDLATSMPTHILTGAHDWRLSARGWQCIPHASAHTHTNPGHNGMYQDTHRNTHVSHRAASPEVLR